MSHDLSRYLTSTSAAFLRDAVAAFSRDSFHPYERKDTIGMQPVEIAIEWLGQNNTSLGNNFHRTEKKREEYEAKCNSNFRAAVREICTQASNHKTTWPEPLEWRKHFKEYPLTETVKEVFTPNEKELAPGSLANALAWSDYNLYRMQQHRFTLAICESLVRDTHTLAHLNEPLDRAKAWMWRQMAHLDSVRTNLILLEGDPLKIQGLRENILVEVINEQHGVSHFFGHLNSQNLSSTSAESRFRDDALRHVQAGFSPNADAKTEVVSYSDLGLG